MARLPVRLPGPGAAAAWAGAAALVLASACASAGPDADRLPLPAVATGKATRHAVDSAQLRDVMRELRGLALDRLPQELQDPATRESRLRDAAAIAEELASASDRIAAVSDEVGLEPDERTAFVTLARRLGEQASSLGADARRRDARAVDRTMTEVDATCVACHELFRDRPRAAPPEQTS